MPAGVLVIGPVPVPVLFTLRVNFAAELNSALTSVAALSVTLQVPVPEQPPPDQPLKTDPSEGVAVRVTSVPWSKLASQVPDLQLMPEGALVTVPEPPPVTLTLSG